MTTDRPHTHDRTDDGHSDDSDDRPVDSDAYHPANADDNSDSHVDGDRPTFTGVADDRTRTADSDHAAEGDRPTDRSGPTDGTDDSDRGSTTDRTEPADNDGDRTADSDRTDADGTDSDRTADSNRTADNDDRTAVADGGSDDGVAADGDDEPDATVTPFAVEGEVDYEGLLERFGADALTDEQVARFPGPGHPMLRRGVYYAGRDVDRFLDAAERGETVSVVTGVGPSGPMHLGHVMPFYLAKYLQDETGAHVYVPLSDDEKYLLKEDLSMDDVHRYTRDNLRDLLAVDLDPDRTRFVVDTLDADAVYPQAVRFAKHVTQATMEATYGEPPNVGVSFYPAVQTAHLLLPQLVHGRHPTLVPIAVDQDPHVRVCRDVAGRAEYDVDKPAALLGKFLPTLAGPGKMSTTDDAGTADDAPAIYLTDDRETVTEKVRRHAYSGGRESVAEHRERGGDPEVDVAFQYLRFLFEPDDETLADLAARYRSGDLLSGEMKEHAIDRIADFLEDHQRRRPEGDIGEAVAPFRLTEEERETLRPDVLG